MIAIVAGEILHNHHLLTWVMYPSTFFNVPFLALCNITILYELIWKSVLVTAGLCRNLSCNTDTITVNQIFRDHFLLTNGWLRTDQQQSGIANCHFTQSKRSLVCNDKYLHAKVA